LKQADHRFCHRRWIAQRDAHHRFADVRFFQLSSGPSAWRFTSVRILESRRAFRHRRRKTRNRSPFQACVATAGQPCCKCRLQSRQSPGQRDPCKYTFAACARSDQQSNTPGGQTEGTNPISQRVAPRRQSAHRQSTTTARAARSGRWTTTQRADRRFPGLIERRQSQRHRLVRFCI
jgi:hypothetical protein